MVLNKRNLSLQPGITFAEVMVTLAIIAIFAAFAVPKYFTYQERVKKEKAHNDIGALTTAVEAFEADTDVYPETLRDLVRPPLEESIRAKWSKGGYIKKDKLPEDPWKHAYVYKLTPEGQEPFEIYSYGPEGPDSPQEKWIRD